MAKEFEVFFCAESRTSENVPHLMRRDSGAVAESPMRKILCCAEYSGSRGARDADARCDFLPANLCDRAYPQGPRTRERFERRTWSTVYTVYNSPQCGPKWRCADGTHLPSVSTTAAKKEKQMAKKTSKPAKKSASPKKKVAAKKKK